MSSKQYTTEFVIKGDSSSGVKATRELQEANADMAREMRRAQRQSEETASSFESVSVHARRLATVSAAVTVAMGTMAVAQTRVVAEQAALARSVGVSVQTLQQWEFAAQSVNLGAGKMGDIFKDTSEKIGDFVSTGGGEAADLFERLNLDINTLMAMRPDQQLIAIGEALDGVATQGEKIFFMESLANDASRLLPLLENNAAALRDQISLADQLGVALPQSDVDSIERASQALNELTALGTAFANAVASEWAPGIIFVADVAKDLTQTLGGMGEVVENVTDFTLLLTGTLAGRMVGALGAASVAAVKKAQADRAVAIQAGITAERETGAALATARRAEAERVAALNSAANAAQRAQAEQVEAAAKLRSIQLTQQQMAAERVLETQRLQAQISATGRQQSLTRLAEIRRTEMALTTQSAAAQRALNAAEVQSAASARTLSAAKVDLARATAATTAAATANTAAVAANTTAQRTLTAVSRGAAGAMALVGGPLGVATLAASAFFLFRDSSDDVSSSLTDMNAPLESVIADFKELSVESQRAAMIKWGDRYQEEVEKTRSALSKIREEVLSIGFDGASGAEARAFFDEVNAGFEAVESGAQSLDELLNSLQDQLGVPDSALRQIRLWAAEYSEGSITVEELGGLLQTLESAFNDVAQGAENSGQAVNSGAPSATTLDAWKKYNDRLRESIAATRDGGSAMGAANRALDAMGEDVPAYLRGVSIFLAVQDEALKDQRKAQQEAAAEARRAAEEAERNAQRQAQAAQQSAEAQAKALAGVQQEMDPLLADHAEYVERLAVLDRALAEGTISEEAYGEAVRWNAEQYQRAATGAEEYEKQTAALVGKYDSHRQKVEALATELQQINERYAAGEIGGAQYARMVEGVREAQYELALETNDLAQILDDMVENTGQRLDDAGVEMFKGLLTGAGDAMDQLEDLLISSIAEIGNALLLRPLTVQITGQLQGLLGQQVTGLPAQGGAGGFNLGSLGSLKNGWDTVSGWLGGGSAASGGLYANALTGSAAAGGLYAGASTGAAVGGLYGNALTGAATTASGGFMSAVGSAMPWIGAGLLVDNLLGLGITDGIVEGISSIFGGGKSDPRLNISTRGDAGQFSHESVRTGAFGAVGFSEGTKRSNDLFGSVEQEREWLASVAALDNLTAAAARTPEQLDAMTAAVQNMVITSEDAQGAIDQLAGRTAAATSVIDSELTQSLIDAGATAEQIAQRFATASSTIDVISAASARLNLQYDAGADGALRYADSLVQAFGSVENIVAIQDAYYNAAFSDQERLQNQYDDVRSALSGLTDEAPRTVEELRAIVEASKLNGEASQKLAYDLMALAPALKQTSQAVRDAITQQYQDVLGRAPAAEGLNYWFDQVASGALTLEGALSSIANSTERLAMDNQAIWDNITSSLEDQYQNTLERDANADDLYYWMTQIESGAVTLDGALAQISNSVEYHATLWQGFESEIAAAYEQSLGRVANGGEMRYWLQQIEAGAVTLDGALSQIAGSIEAAEFDAAGGAAGLRERAQLNRQLLQAQGNTEALRALELEALHEANRPLQERIWALQDEQKALREAEQNQQRYNQALESAQSAFASFSVGIDDWLAQLRGTEQGLGSPADQLAATSEAFEEQFAKALTGDRDALGSITQYADRFIEAQKGWSASGMLTTSTIDRVSGMLESLPDLLSPEEFLAEEFRNALGDQSDTLSAAFDASTAAAVSALIPKFDAIDTNTDGLLTFSELSAALAGKATDAEIRALISRVDANGDGMISEQELANYRLGRVASDIGSELEPMFDAIDLNTDGLIDYAEFGRYFSGLATDAELKNIFRTLDADGDGQISRLEAIKGSSQNTDNQTDSLARFFDRAGNPSWGLRVSMSYHQDESAIQSIGWHVANEIAAMAANGQYVDKFANGGVFSGGVQAFANGGVFTNAIVSSPTLFNMGLMGEEDPEAIVPLSRGAGGRLGIDATGLMRLPDGPLDLPMPNVQMPQFPALGGSDVVQVLNDLRNENKQLRNDINRLLGSSNTHLAAANVQRGAAATQQIAATKEGNKMLKKMQDDARLEAAKR